MMGKTLDAFLGKNSKNYKLRSLLNLAISRLAVLKKHRQSHLTLARSDVLQLLNLGQHERALLRVEQVMKEQNMLDVFSMLEGYSLLLTERINLIEQHNKECPDELKEAISNLIFANSRCGEFPELQEIREVFTSRYGKEFTSCAVELRNNCGVNPKMIQKLSTRQPSLEARMNAIQYIANENGIILQETPKGANGHEEVENRTHGSNRNSGDDFKDFCEEIAGVDNERWMNRRKHYKDAGEAAEDAFLSAAYSAAAARAAVELSKSNPNTHSPTMAAQNLKKSPLRRNSGIEANVYDGGHDNSNILVFSPRVANMCVIIFFITISIFISNFFKYV